MKNILCFFLFIFCFLNLAAQKNTSPFRLYTGITISNQVWEQAYTKKEYGRNYRVGLLIGLSRESLLLNWLKLRYGCRYSSLGFKEAVSVKTSANKNIDLKLSNRLDYVSFDFSTKLRNHLSKFSPYFVFGLNVNLLTYIDAHPIFEYELNNFNSFNIGGELGVGVESNSKKLPFFVEVNYQKNISPASWKDQLRVYNFGYLIKTGFLFSLNRPTN